MIRILIIWTILSFEEFEIELILMEWVYLSGLSSNVNNSKYLYVLGIVLDFLCIFIYF